MVSGIFVGMDPTTTTPTINLEEINIASQKTLFFSVEL